MYESAAMMAFLAETLPAARMTPAAGSSARALMLQWLVLLSAGTYESNLRHCYPERYGEPVSVKASAHKEIDRIYGVLEADIARKGPYLCGSELCAADIYLAMLASWYEPDATALGERFPRVLAIHDAVAGRPTWQRVQAAHAS
jgi:glutathione S-transferase